MADEKPEAAMIKVVVQDNPFAPEVFATGAPSFWIYQGNVHITLESARTAEPGSNTVNRVACARIVMPIVGAQELAAGLYDFLKKNGHDPVPVPADKPLQ